VRCKGVLGWATSGHRLISEIVRASTRLTKAADRFLLPFGLTSAQYDLLLALGPNFAGLGHSEAGVRLGVTRANVTGLVRRLEARGLCRVDARTDDARAKTVRATPAGARLLARIEAPWNERVRGFTRLIPERNQERIAEDVSRLEPILRPAIH